jgi:diguanylate cyclase (GGDEF)-like protein
VNQEHPADNEPRASAPELGVKPHGSSDKAQPRALVVDDDIVVRVSLQRFCEKRGFATRARQHGREALAALEEAPADVVLLDAQMPYLDGFETCAAIRAMPQARHTPIIMITASADESSVDRAFAVGANEYITKPVHWAVLGHRVQQLISASRAERALRDDRAFLQSLVNAIPDPTLVCDSDGVVTWSNRAVAFSSQMCDVSVGAPLAFLDTVREADGDRLPSDALAAVLLESLITEGRSEQRLLMRQGKGSAPVFAELHARPLRDDQGGSKGMILRWQDVTEREIERRRLHSEISHYDKLAHHDALTGLGNRRLFLERLDEALPAARERGASLAVYFIDLDGFKRINDTYGHEVGDLVLRTVATRLRGSLRQSDTVARLGGDEFAVLLLDPPNKGLIRKIGTKLLKAVCAPLPREVSRFDVGASIGIAIFPDDADEAQDLLQKADSAMYEVKHSGKGAFRFVDEPGAGEPEKSG